MVSRARIGGKKSARIKQEKMTKTIKARAKILKRQVPSSTSGKSRLNKEFRAYLSRHTRLSSDNRKVRDPLKIKEIETGRRSYGEDPIAISSSKEYLSGIRYHIICKLKIMTWINKRKNSYHTAIDWISSGYKTSVEEAAAMITQKVDHMQAQGSVKDVIILEQYVMARRFD